MSNKTTNPFIGFKPYKRTRLIKRNNQLFAQNLLSEIPITQLNRIINYNGSSVAKGGFCGGGCGDTAGTVCGLGCSPELGANDVIDVQGKLGFTKRDLDNIKTRMPELRKAVQAELLDVVGRLRL